MNSTKKRLSLVFLAFILAVLFAPAAFAKLTLASFFSNNGILQRDQEIPIWGTAEAGEKVTVSFHGQTQTVLANAEGRWELKLSPIPAQARGETLTVSGSGGDSITLNNIVVGDIWLCSGQSNMEWTMQRSKNSEEELANSNYPAIRLYTVGRNPSEKPVDNVPSEWVECSAQTVGPFSGVGYYFGRALYQRLQVPIGLINSSYGGTLVEAWMSEEALRSTPASQGFIERYKERVATYPAEMEKYENSLAQWESEKAEAEKAGKAFKKRAPRKPEGAGSRWMPASLYNGMIHPLIKAAIKGVIWYQGESNDKYYEDYAVLFPLMVQQWRKDFRQENLPFYYVQIANCFRRTDATGMLWAYQREAQESALRLPHTGMAVTIDIGEDKDIHPKNKQDVGARLARIAFADVYGLGGEYSGPVFKSMKVEGNDMRVSFDHAEGLKSTTPSVEGFEIAGKDGRYYAAQARIDGDSVLVSSSRVKDPENVRYAWHNTPVATLANGEGLPARPFRTDKQPLPQE